MPVYKRLFWTSGVASVAALAALITPGLAHADEVVVGNLSIKTTDNPPITTTNTVKLSATKPSMVKAEPMYRGTPMYGVITLGNAANNKTVVVLDTFPNDTKPRLIVDLKGNGDLTAEPPYALTPLAPAGKAGARGVSDNSGNPNKHTPVPYAAVVSKFMTRYDIKGLVREESTPLQFLLDGTELTYSPNVAHIGTLTIGDRNITIALVDQNGDGIFNQYTHAEDTPAKVLILVDRNGDGRFDLKREAFDIAKPFRVGGGAYEIANIDARGTMIALKK